MRLNDWKTKPVRSRRSRVAASSDSWLMDWPSRTTSPVVGRSSPPSSWRSVDLPEPDGPIRATNSPASTVRRHAAQRLDGGRTERVGLGQVAGLEDRGHRRSLAGRSVGTAVSRRRRTL